MQIYQLWVVLAALAATLGFLLVGISSHLRPERARSAWLTPTLPALPFRIPLPIIRRRDVTTDDQGLERHRKIVRAGESAVRELLSEADSSQSYYASLEKRLEQAFELYTRGRISIDTYATMIRGEMQAIDRLRIDQLAGDLNRFGPDVLRRKRVDNEDLALADDALAWCLSWAEMRGAIRPEDCISPVSLDA